MELKDMASALLAESNLKVSADVVGSIVDKTMKEADSKRDGKIDQEEWKDYVTKNPSLSSIPSGIGNGIPQLLLNSEVDDKRE